MAKIDFKVHLEKETLVKQLEGFDIMVHCHHFMSYLHRTIEDAGYVDGVKIEREAAEETVFDVLKNYFALHPELVSDRDRLYAAGELFRYSGFGLLDFSRITREGGAVVSPSSFLAQGWKARFGLRQDPCCYFTCGFIAAAVELAYNQGLRVYRVEESLCIAKGDPNCEFKVEVI